MEYFHILIFETSQHIPGEFQPSKVYVSIDEHGYALDDVVCKQEPIFDEYGQEPEHYFEQPPSVEDLPIPMPQIAVRSSSRKRKLIDISTDEVDSSNHSTPSTPKSATDTAG